MTWLLVAAGAAVGASARYLLGVWLNGRAPLPWGTFTANVAGSLGLGGLVGVDPVAHVYALLGIGFCGAFTTYSTFAWELHTLGQVNRVHGSTYALATVVCGVAAAGLGWTLTSSL